MTNETLTEALLAKGFTHADQVKDFGSVLDGVVYLRRVRDWEHQHVSLCSYLGDFVEAVVLIYDKPYNSRLKPQQTALFAALPRNLEDLLTVIEKKYAQPTKSSNSK